jgi:hypothetical protein
MVVAVAAGAPAAGRALTKRDQLLAADAAQRLNLPSHIPEPPWVPGGGGEVGEVGGGRAGDGKARSPSAAGGSPRRPPTQAELVAAMLNEDTMQRQSVPGYVKP